MKCSECTPSNDTCPMEVENERLLAENQRLEDWNKQVDEANTELAIIIGNRPHPSIQARQDGEIKRLRNAIYSASQTSPEHAKNILTAALQPSSPFRTNDPQEESK